MNFVLISICLLSILVAVRGASVLMQNVDIYRSGWNANETTLTARNVPQLQQLGLIHTVTPCSTQLLYYENLNLQGHKNVLFCWSNPNTNNGNMTVYAFDADTFAEIWSNYIGQSAIWTSMAPVINPIDKHIYNIFKRSNDDGYNYLVGIDIMTGKQLQNSPHLINATAPGTGAASVGGEVPFQNTEAPGSGRRTHADSRTSLLFIKNTIFVGFAHNTDSSPYHGWVFAYHYDTSSNQFVQNAHYCVTPNAGEGGVWQSGHGIASDGNYIYYTTGNGDFNLGKKDMSMAAMKMGMDLSLQDYFVPANWKKYSDSDLDMGGCGAVFIPKTHYIVVGITKYGAVHLIDTDNMGKFDASKDSCRQTISVRNGFVPPSGNPVAWNDGKTARIYIWSDGLSLMQFNLNPATNMIALPYNSWNGQTGGGGLFITSNNLADPILWAFKHNGGLLAFDATKEVSAGPIWSSNVRGGIRWVWPTVANGKVYTPSSDGIHVFGVK